MMASWRIHETHREETTAVKAALKKAGLRFCKVSHGSGTNWAWLHIYLPKDQEWSHQLNRRVIQVVQAPTGRHGDYDGDILVTG